MMAETQATHSVLSIRQSSWSPESYQLFGRTHNGEFELCRGGMTYVLERRDEIADMIRFCDGNPGGVLEISDTDRAAAVALIDEWLADESGYDEATWAELRAAFTKDVARGANLNEPEENDGG